MFLFRLLLSALSIPGGKRKQLQILIIKAKSGHSTLTYASKLMAKQICLCETDQGGLGNCQWCASR